LFATDEIVRARHDASKTGRRRRANKPDVNVMRIASLAKRQISGRRQATA